MKTDRGSDTPQAAESRARILDAALNAFWANGYHTTTTREIATAAGMSPAGVYVYFQSKQQILGEIVAGSHAQLLEVLQAVPTTDTDPGRRLARLVGAFSAFHAEHQRIALVAEREMQALDPEEFDRVREIRQGMVDLFRSAVVDGIESDQFDADHEHLNQLVLAMVAIGKDLARWYQPGGPMTPDDFAALHGEMALRLVGVESERST